MVTQGFVGSTVSTFRATYYFSYFSVKRKKNMQKNNPKKEYHGKRLSKSCLVKQQPETWCAIGTLELR